MFFCFSSLESNMVFLKQLVASKHFSLGLQLIQLTVTKQIFIDYLSVRYL